MATVLLAVANTAAVSADIVLADGDIANIFVDLPAGFNGPEDQATIDIEMKHVDNSYVVIGRIGTELKIRAVKITDAGTFRLNRPAQIAAIGAQRG
jgi:hypothetical protein